MTVRSQEAVGVQLGVTVWFTGLSGAGKTTIARRVEELLRSMEVPVERLDGDVLRQSLTRDLGFSAEDRQKNIERARFVAKLLTRHGVVVLAAFIAPYAAMREACRREIGSYLEVYVKASLETLIARDVKGLYRRALRGELKGLTGVDDPYEEPEHPDLVLDTDRDDVERCARQVVELLRRRGYLPQEASRPVPVPARAVLADAVAQLPGPILPHGGHLVDRRLMGEALAEARRRIRDLPSLVLDEVALADLEMLGVGAMSPLEGFMGRADYQAVVEGMRLADGLVWPLPITLAVDRDQALSLREGHEVTLRDAQGHPVGLLEVREVFSRRREHEAAEVFRTTDLAHPGVARLYRQGEYLVGGPVWVLDLPGRPFLRYRLTPLETRRAFDARGWRRVVAFQTRNPVHRAHEYIQKTAMEITDGLLLHPLVGATKEDDVPADVRMESYEVLISQYYPKDRVLLSVFPAAMRYAGPREAVFHAICRKNYGCTHFIVGRDHAGVGNYYGPYDAQHIFSRFAPAELGIQPLFFENAFFCRRCQGMATAKTCPHPESDRVTLSGTMVRAMLRQGQEPPPEYSRPEVARLLARAMAVEGAEEGPTAAGGP